MSEEQQICRVVKHETLKGTFYHAEYRKECFRFFGSPKYKWQKFFISNECTIKPLCPYNHYEHEKLKSIDIAEYCCELYIRANLPDTPVKVWSINNDKDSTQNAS